MFRFSSTIITVVLTFAVSAFVVLNPVKTSLLCGEITKNLHQMAESSDSQCPGKMSDTLADSSAEEHHMPESDDQPTGENGNKSDIPCPLLMCVACQAIVDSGALLLPDPDSTNLTDTNEFLPSTFVPGIFRPPQV